MRNRTLLPLHTMPSDLLMTCNHNVFDGALNAFSCAVLHTVIAHVDHGACP